MDLAGRVGVQRDQVPFQQQRPDLVERCRRAGAVGDVLEEGEDTAHVVGAELQCGCPLDAGPQQLGGPVQPRVLDAARVQGPAVPLW